MKDVIKKALEDSKMTQKELAETIHVTAQAVSKWIKGDSQPTLDNVKLMEEVFGNGFAEKIIKKGIKSKMTMKKQLCSLSELDSMEKAVNEANRLLDDSGARNYSHATYTLLTWFVPAVIGLTYHNLINRKTEEEYTYEDIFYFLNSYFEEKKGYSSELAYQFYLMGGDLFESFGDYKLKNHNYAEEAMQLWYTFEKAIGSNKNSNISNEFIIALTKIICDNSCY